MTTAARHCGAIVGVAVLAAIAWLSAGTGSGQPPAAGNNQGGPPPGTSGEINECRACHFPGPDPNGPAGGFIRDFKSQEYVRLNESAIWNAQDPHSMAFEVIIPEKNTIAKQMQSVLATASSDPAKYRIDRDVRCLTCHATDLNPKSKEPRLLGEFTAQESIGVGCSACHGVDERWRKAHYGGNRVADGSHLRYRTLPPEKKHADFGMTNVRDPAIKAALCASCHVGNPDEGKVVTHEMYAAGHPPLPPFELMTFMEAQPRHWGYPTELPFLTGYAAKDPLNGWATFRFWGGKSEAETKAEFAARHVAVGAVTALKAEMQTIAADAKAHAGGGLVDFARFDCYACHHDLQYPSARQQRGYDGPPGRPPLKAWVAALPAVVAEHATGLPQPDLKTLGGEFAAKWQAVKAAALDKPFGDPAKLAAAAGGVAMWCDAYLRAVQKEPVYTKAAADDLLQRVAVAAGSDKRAADAEAAMHLTWAYRSLRQSLSGDAAKLDPLKDNMPLAPRDVSAFPKDRKRPITVGEILPQRQRLFNSYSAEAFTKAFRELAGAK